MRGVFLLLAFVSSIGTASSAAQTPPRDPQAFIARLADFDRATRVDAARQIRRLAAADAVPALTTAVRGSADQFIRYRALVLLTSFEDPSTDALMRTLMTDRNDRVREVTYRWREDHPEPAMTQQLLAALATEQAEFVRPALVGALARLGSDTAVRRALVVEAGRGLDFFRAAVIDALGRARADWALAAVTAAAEIDGPLRDDALIALGRIGDRGSLSLIGQVPSRPVDAAMASEAARCLLGDDCASRVAGIAAVMVGRTAPAEALRAGATALAALTSASADALPALMRLLQHPAARDAAAIGLGAAALRHPDELLAWLETLDDGGRIRVLEALRDAFDRLEEDYAEERFFAAARKAYWGAPENSPRRVIAAALIDTLEF